jgi:RNA polymerase sigma-70 factor (ECF subfamily)
MEQEQLITQLKNGDNKAFNELINQYRVSVINLCYGFVRNQEDAEDIAQEVFIEIFRSISNFRGDSKLSTWIYRIAVSRALNKVRKNKFNQLFTSLDILFDYRKTINTNSPHQILQSKENASLLQHSINKLPENQKIAFVLHHYDDHSYQQISEIMGCSLSSVESLIHRAKTNLNKKLIHLK